MAKDAKGHGSNRRAQRVWTDARRYKPVGSGGKSTVSPEDAARTSYSPNKSGAHNGPLVSNAAAAAALASGPKSAPTPVHEAMTEHGVRYQPGVTGGALSLHSAYGADWKKHDEKVRSIARRRYGSGPD